jgi:S1-C subfamily serine protease
MNLLKTQPAVIVKIFVAMIVIAAFATGCRQINYQQSSQQQDDSRYFDESTAFNRSFQLEELAGSVKKLFCIVEYDIYHFNDADGITVEKFNAVNLRRSAFARSTFNETVFGTATIVQNNRNGILLLTCAHIVSNPDTIVTFYQSTTNTQNIESIAIKKTQMTFIRDIPGNNLVKTIAIDLNRDIAFLNERFTGQTAHLPELDMPVGNAADLRWSMPVYLMGFPGGQQLVTKSVVGNPNPSSSGDFVIDATFNPGGSGSLVLAMNQQTQGFELVGMVKATAASYTNILKPESESHQEVYNPNIPYSGEIYAHRVREIYHGVTYAVSVNTIRDFYVENRRAITREGFNLDGLFGL